MPKIQPTGPSESLVDARLADWSRAELEGDVDALDALLHPDFLGVGPYGFLLDRAQWLSRFSNGLHYDAFEFTAMGSARPAADVSIVVGTQSQRGAYNAQPADGVFRTSLVLAGPDALIAHLQISLGSPPGMPS